MEISLRRLRRKVITLDTLMQSYVTKGLFTFFEIVVLVAVAVGMIYMIAVSFGHCCVLEIFSFEKKDGKMVLSSSSGATLES